MLLIINVFFLMIIKIRLDGLLKYGSVYVSIYSKIIEFRVEFFYSLVKIIYILFIV